MIDVNDVLRETGNAIKCVPCRFLGMVDNYGLFDTLYLWEVAVFLIRPDSIKKVKMIPYYEYIEPDEKYNFRTVLINIDVRLEKEGEYAQFTWTSTADGYREKKDKRNVEDTLVYELNEMLCKDIDRGEAETFWEHIPWDDLEWKPL